MMTIKAFASLCGCSTQALRYYDRVGVLRPVKVDQWSGYRYYEKKQALDYVKIKNLQAADFTIGEICELLAQPDEVIYAAFEKQIAAQEEKLERIRQIQQTYLREKSSMEKIIGGITGYLLGGCMQLETCREFGIPLEEQAETIAAVEEWLAGLIRTHSAEDTPMSMFINGEEIPDAESFTARLEQLGKHDISCNIHLACDSSPTVSDNVSYQVVWEKHGWSHVYEFLSDIPAPEKKQEQRYCFLLADDTYKNGAFAVFLFGWMLRRYGDAVHIMSCIVERSSDGRNHFALQRRK